MGISSIPLPSMHGLGLQSHAGAGKLFENLKMLQAPPESESPGESAPPQDVVLDLKGARLSMMEISLEMHLERTVFNHAGQAIGVETFDAQVRIQEIEMELRAIHEGKGQGKPEEGGEMPDALKKLLEHFGVEKTAGRIADFVQKGFGRTSFGAEETEASRRNFVDFILPFIRQGVDSALAMFGELPEEIRGQAEQTYARVGELLERFVRGPEEPKTVDAAEGAL